MLSAGGIGVLPKHFGMVRALGTGADDASLATATDDDRGPRIGLGVQTDEGTARRVVPILQGSPHSRMR